MNHEALKGRKRMEKSDKKKKEKERSNKEEGRKKEDKGKGGCFRMGPLVGWG